MGCGRSVPVAEQPVSDKHSEPEEVVSERRDADEPEKKEEEAETAADRVRKREDEMAKKLQSKDPARDAARAEQRAAAKEELLRAAEMESELEHAGQAGWGLGDRDGGSSKTRSRLSRRGGGGDDEEEDDEPGKGVKLRQVGGGAGGTRTRRNPLDLQSGHVIARIRGEVAEDMVWDEVPPEPTAAAEIPEW